MNFFNKYKKYKNKYLKLKFSQAQLKLLKGGNKKIIKNWKQRVNERKLELEDLKNSKSFVPIKKLSGRDKIYYIHDNGGVPFKVIANDRNIIIYKRNLGDDKEKYDNIVIKLKNFLGYWSGFDSSVYKDNGNSILIQITIHKYIYVGSEIYKFNTDEEIIDYISPLGNSDVPYPVAYGSSYVYFMLDKKKININDLKTSVTVANAEDLYGEFYLKNVKRYDFDNVKIIQNRI